MPNFSFECPYCGRPTTIVESNFFSLWEHIYISEPSGGAVGFQIRAITCPNDSCKKLWLHGRLTGSTPYQGRHLQGPIIHEWQLLPQSEAKVFPDYIPKAIMEDYYEACRIRDLSPKASATLARRCLQGMIRDFWKIKKKSLKLEVDVLKKLVDTATWKGIDAVRSVGNIGAHMEKDINLIVDVEPDEAQLLISLIERLEKDWYEERKRKDEHLAELEELANEKKTLRKVKP